MKTTRAPASPYRQKAAILLRKIRQVAFDVTGSTIGSGQHFSASDEDIQATLKHGVELSGLMVELRKLRA